MHCECAYCVNVVVEELKYLLNYDLFNETKTIKLCVNKVDPIVKRSYQSNSSEKKNQIGERKVLLNVPTLSRSTAGTNWGVNCRWGFRGR